MRYIAPLTAGLLLVLACPASACDLCTPQGPPLSRHVHNARFVVFGPIVSAKLGADNLSGTSEVKIEGLVKTNGTLKENDTLTLPRYAPPDPKFKYLIFVDVVKGQLDPYLVIPFPANTRVVAYLKNAPPYDPQAKPEDKARRLLYYFKPLQDPEPEIAADAYKEWATASNLEVGLAAPHVSAADLRAWLLDPKTPTMRLSLYGFLLGACGTDQDADLLRRMVLNPNERTGNALDGLLAGYIRLRPQDGWKLTLEVLGDTRRPFLQRHSILRLLRFYHGYQPREAREPILRCMAQMLSQPDMLDLAIDQLRSWQLWELTGRILALWGTKDADAPVTKRSIIRYALLCPLPEAKQFVAMVRQQDPRLVKEVEENLPFEARPRE